MKEVEKNEIKRLSDRLDAIRHQQADMPLVEADMGKLKKSVRGLVVVHPMTALGREMGLQEMTGFSKTAF